MNTNDLNGKYLSLTCRECVIEQQVITRMEKLQLTQSKPNVDFFYDESTGEGSIRTKNNKLIQCSAISYGSWSLLKSILLKAGDLIPLASENHVSATVRRIRILFQDDKSGFYIITQRDPHFAIRWNSKRSWRIIKPFELDKAGESIPRQIINPENTTV